MKTQMKTVIKGKPETQLFLIPESFSIKDAMTRMTQIGLKALFIIDSEGKLLGALGDGDIRKWILRGGSLKESVKKIYTRKPKFVKEGYKVKDVRSLMLKSRVVCVPVVKKNREIIKILTWEDIFSDKAEYLKDKLDMPVVIMAGGKGKRLDPFTRILPKPLIPIGDKPIIEIIMDKFNEYGIEEFFVSVNHKARMIRSYFEDINNTYKIHYIEEKVPLGTAGSLQFLKDKIKNPFLVTNCDIIIEENYANIVKLHKEHNNDMTLVVSCRHFAIPYGVCEIENGGVLKNIKEKPEYEILANTGMYVMNSELLDVIPSNKLFNINDLTAKARGKGYRIGIYPISDNDWVDVGQWTEYHKAIEQIKKD